MNTELFANLMQIASAPVVDAPLAIAVTNRGLSHVASMRACDDFARRRAVATALHTVPAGYVECDALCCHCIHPAGQACPDCAAFVADDTARALIPLPALIRPSAVCPVCGWETPCMCGVIEPDGNGCYED